MNRIPPWKGPVAGIDRHGWQLAACRPWLDSVSIVARQDATTLFLNDHIPLPLRETIAGEITEARRLCRPQGYTEIAHRCLRVNNLLGGYLVFARGAGKIGLQSLGVQTNRFLPKGLGTAVTLALMHGAFAAGDIFELLQIVNPWAVHAILTQENVAAIADVKVHLVQNNLLASEEQLLTPGFRLPRTVVPLADWQLTELSSVPNHPWASGRPEERLKQWVEKIAIRKRES
ncbi:MAG: hypothetical protein HY543_00505 [Deltaproteobacteria bacterium]|nr:hypothetical protein [Deltaproteobacteria bacterium]